MKKAIPTRYNGVTFRSRLEARWAAFFDSVSWPWEYEPVDLAGYIPDFVLQFTCGPILVEVKPELDLAEYAKHADRAALAGWRDEILVLGAAIWAGESGHGVDVIGWGAEPFRLGGDIEFAPAAMEAFRCIDCGAFSLKSAEHSYRCRVRGCYDGASHVGSLDHGELASVWRAAGNRVQWKAPPSAEVR